MNTLIKISGVIVMTCAIIGLPMLTVIAIAFGWDGFFCAILTLMTAFEAFCVGFEIFDRVDN